MAVHSIGFCRGGVQRKVLVANLLLAYLLLANLLADTYAKVEADSKELVARKDMIMRWRGMKVV